MKFISVVNILSKTDQVVILYNVRRNKMLVTVGVSFHHSPINPPPLPPLLRKCGTVIS